MSNYERIKYYYDKGLYKASHIEIFLSKKVITQDEYNAILGITEET